jgi:hypothetical protein
MDREFLEERRGFLKQFGATLGAAGLASTGIATTAHAQVKPKGNIPDRPIKVGHITFLTGPAELLGGPGQRGHLLAQEEINARGGILGKRKIETIFADEAAGTDGNVKELRRMKLAERIELFTGVISSGNTPALGPVAEELKILTLFNDGCTDFLFDKAVPNPKYTFRVTNIQSADGVTAAIGAATHWPKVRRIASLQPDYSYGRNVFEHFALALGKPGRVPWGQRRWELHEAHRTQPLRRGTAFRDPPLLNELKKPSVSLPSTGRNQLPAGHSRLAKVAALHVADVMLKREPGVDPSFNCEWSQRKRIQSPWRHKRIRTRRGWVQRRQLLEQLAELMPEHWRTLGTALGIRKDEILLLSEFSSATMLLQNTDEAPRQWQLPLLPRVDDPLLQPEED